MVASEQLERGLRVVQLNRYLAFLVDGVFLDESEQPTHASFHQIQAGSGSLHGGGVEYPICRRHVVVHR
jgi:hypothetical protein